MHITPQLAAFAPELIIFDKDGTLIDFHAMWAGWVIELAGRLERHTGRPLSDRLFEVMAFDPDSGRITPDGHLALTPAGELRRLTIEVLQAAGLSSQAVAAAMAAAWHIPNPVTLARPITDLALLFSTLQAHAAKIAIATSDDRLPTETLLVEMKIAPLVDTLICADDGVPIKPAPDMILTICDRLDTLPAKTVMVGDNVPDLQMGRAAGVGLTIGVLSGLGSAETLAGYADMLLPSVRELIQE